MKPSQSISVIECERLANMIGVKIWVPPYYPFRVAGVLCFRTGNNCLPVAYGYDRKGRKWLVPLHDDGTIGAPLLAEDEAKDDIIETDEEAFNFLNEVNGGTIEDAAKLEASFKANP